MDQEEVQWLVPHYPMRDLGITREDVFAILEETSEIPAFYRFRSRSGCAICPFMRPAEMLGTLKAYPVNFFQAENYERLVDSDQARFQIYGEDWSGKHIGFSIPNFVDIRSADDFALSAPEPSKLSVRKVSDNQFELFGSDNVDVYVGVEYLADPLMAMFGKTHSGTPGVHFSELVGWSTSKGGISRKLSTHYWTRMDTCEVFGLDQESFKEQYKMAVFHLSVPGHLIDLKPTAKGTYSWRKDEPMAMIRHAANIIKRTLHVRALESDIEALKPFARKNCWEAEHLAGLKAQHKSLGFETAELLKTYQHLPGKRPVPKTPAEQPCTVCSK